MAEEKRQATHFLVCLCTDQLELSYERCRSPGLHSEGAFLPPVAAEEPAGGLLDPTGSSLLDLLLNNVNFFLLLGISLLSNVVLCIFWGTGSCVRYALQHRNVIRHASM